MLSRSCGQPNSDWTNLHAVEGLEELAPEHAAAVLAVRECVEAEVGLHRDGLVDGLVGRGVERRHVQLAGVERRAVRQQRLGAEEGADVLGAEGGFRLGHSGWDSGCETCVCGFARPLCGHLRRRVREMRHLHMRQLSLGM
jgi:hypothetical protein